MDPITAIGKVAGPSGVSAIGDLDSLATTVEGPGNAVKPEGGLSFSSLLKNAQEQISAADVAAEQVATGELTDIHQYTVLAGKAQLAIQLTTALRDRALESFQEIMRMQI